MGGNPSKGGKDIEVDDDFAKNARKDRYEREKSIDEAVKNRVCRFFEGDRDAKKFKFIQVTGTDNIEKLTNYGILPLNVIHRILLYLPVRDHLHVTLTSKLFLTLFWKSYCENVMGSEAVKKEEDKYDNEKREKMNYKQLYYMRRKIVEPKCEDYYSDRYKKRTDWANVISEWKKKAPRDIVSMIGDDDESELLPFKICLTGPSQCGKSSLVLRFVRDQFFENQEPTELWDTAGQVRYHTLMPIYLRGSTVILLCFSLTDREKFDHDFKKVFLVEVLKAREKSGFSHSHCVILVGLKSDLVEETSEEVISREEIIDLAMEFGFHNYVECSSKNRKGVVKVFGVAAEFVEKNILELQKYHPVNPVM